MMRQRWISLIRHLLSRYLLLVLILLIDLLLLLVTHASLIVFEPLALSRILKDHSIHHLEWSSLILHHPIDGDVHPIGVETQGS
jgi:uncharacterized BrkB/YihY/UPF0761 family membrane protein